MGCIHTSQGLESDYVGVIIGKDLRYQNGVVITDFSVHPRRDVSFKDSSNHNCSAEMADFIIRNTYKTLMTRGHILRRCKFVELLIEKGSYIQTMIVRAFSYFLGPINLSPLRCIICSGISEIHTSVSQASDSENFLNVLKSGKAVT